MKIDWIIVAEGLGAASNGAITAIGVNQVLIVTRSLPTTTKRAVFAHLVAEDGSLTDKDLGVSIKVTSPSGEVIAAQTASAKTGTPLWPDLPVTFDIFADFPLRLAEYGTYVIGVEITDPNGDRAKGKVNIYVRKPA